MTLRPLLLACASYLIIASPVLAQATFTEDFNTTTYKDSIVTTADWDSTSGELSLFPFALAQLGNAPTTRALAVAVAGDLAFVADSTAGLRVVDISDPGAPSVAGTMSLSGPAWDVTVSGGLAFVAADNAGLQIIDISDPTLPSLTSAIVTPGGGARRVVVAGDLAFVVDGDLQVVDISTPGTPFLVASQVISGVARSLEVAGDHVYVSSDSGLDVVDITLPNSPNLVGSYITPGSGRDVAIAGDMALVADSNAGIHAIDITDPTSPTLLGTFDTPGVASGIEVDGDVAYVADGPSGLQLLDISDPSLPSLIDTFATPGIAHGVAIEGGMALVADGAAGLELIQVSTPIIPAPLLTANYNTPDYAQGVAIAGDHVYVADWNSGLQVIDITDPTSPTLAGTYNTSGPALGVAVSGDHAFVADGGSGLQVISIVDPTTPALVGTYNTPNIAYEVAISGDHAFVADFGGLVVVDISDPMTPTLAGTYSPGGLTYGVAVSGDRAFLANSTGLVVIDISDPTTPTPAGTYNTGGQPRGVVVSGTLAFVADQDSGVVVIDISDPMTPMLVSIFDTPGAAFGVAVSGDELFVADFPSGLLALDIGDPANPALIASYSSLVAADHVAVSGDHVFVADGDAGLQVVHVRQREMLQTAGVGQSLAVDGATSTIPRARLMTTQSAGVSWEISSDAGLNWTPFAPNGTWTLLDVPGDQLLWRSTHTWSPGLNPTVSQLTLDWLNRHAVLTAINDVPDDQGKQVRVMWTRSGHDFVGDPMQIVEYAVYRKIDGGFSASVGQVGPQADGTLSPAAREQSLVMLAAGWDFVTTVPVRAEDEYAVVVPTLTDSTISSGLHQSTFFVSALTATPGVFFDSPPDSGYSIDNLAPGAPQALSATHVAGGVDLEWAPAPETDFQYFRVYRSSDPGFVPDSGTLIHETASTSFQDSPPNPEAAFYKITSLDFAGNESPPASSGSVVAVGDGRETPRVFALRTAKPNPFRSSTHIAFDLPRESPVSLQVFDVTGRLVRSLARESMPAGGHEVSWDGNDGGGRQVAAGVYLYRLRAGAFESTRRMVLVR